MKRDESTLGNETEKDESERKSKNRNLKKKKEYGNGVCLRIRRGSSKTGKY